jgi:hypothetical protein
MEVSLMNKFNYFELVFLLMELSDLLDELNIEYIAIKRKKNNRQLAPETVIFLVTNRG